MLHERSSDIASFMERSVCSISKMYSVLVLVLLFLFATIHPKCMCKSHFFKNFRCSAKEASILVLLWSALYIVFPKCIVSWFWFFYFDLPLFTPNVCIKVIFLKKFRCSAKEASILHPSWSTLYIALWKCKVFWFYFLYFNLSIFT